MKIGIIQASSQKNKNDLLYNCVKKVVKDKGYEVINFGVFKDEECEYSYIEIAICISILLESKAVDFIVTGCSSGQGMMLACNSLPNILCGYIENPSDAYLFGRINNGNAVSFPLGLNFGWAGEINLQCTLEKLFDEPFGIGYPKQDAVRKQKDTKMLKVLNNITKRSLVEVIPKVNLDLMKRVLKRDNVYDYVIKNSENEELKALLQLYR
ncbi:MULTISPECIES: RpiB/LacA/LacB family sugar-phosphate isomerase [unclassified Clostridium]|uniref:RpiB/LacA/LacB family sugar-phosphate isomerase n=1 Tax=unclassified Clostridium TaxID=2614128 RepID=UPI00207A504D|nr:MULTISPECIES: RpiB/LacA/LacB family sugar-phosphate isomerase [unclassified Clostridium]